MSLAQQPLTILSWNTLCYDDAWFDGWGCPLEIERRNALMDLQKNLTMEDAQQILTKERYYRIRHALLKEMMIEGDSLQTDPSPDFVLLQELTHDDPWDDEQDENFADLVAPLYDRVSCQDDYEGNLQRVYVRKDSGWTVKHDYGLEADVLEGGCLVELAHELHDELFLVNLHGKSGPMRDPRARKDGLKTLWDEVEGILGNDSVNNTDDDATSKLDRLVICGDWNTHLTDLPQIFSDWGPSPPIAALLKNQTQSDFSTNHEAGFLAQYDGCILASSPSLQLHGVSRNLKGFMPKGQNGKLTGDFSY
ncbi:MAG: hypothetical protein SGARI_006943, partial [Bacillariaceae sp.]